jgi:hypothetical protein
MAEPNNDARRHNQSHREATMPPGVISILEVYTLDEAKARLRWTDSALRAAKRRGLGVIVCGKRRYLTGREIRRFFESLQSNETQ